MAQNPRVVGQAKNVIESDSWKIVFGPGSETGTGESVRAPGAHLFNLFENTEVFGPYPGPDGRAAVVVCPLSDRMAE
jgi:hypothetical protein